MKKAGEYPRKISSYNELRKFMAEFRDAECARKFGVSRERVRQLRKRYKIKSPNTPVCSLKSFTEEELSEILKMLNKGIRVIDIAIKLKRHHESIYAILRKHNINIKEYCLERKETIHPNSKLKELEQAKELYKKGYSLFRIGKNLGLSSALPYIWRNKGHFDLTK